MNELNKNQKGFSGVEILMVIIIVALLGIVGWMVYHNHHKTVSVKTNTTKTTTGSGSLTDQTVKISPLGVQITVPYAIKDLSFSINQQMSTDQSFPTVNISTTSLTKLDIACSATTADPLGELSKTSGQYPSDPTVDNSSGQLVKQFSTYYISYRSPQSACSSSSSTNTFATSLIPDLKSSLPSITLIQ